MCSLCSARKNYIRTMFVFSLHNAHIFNLDLQLYVYNMYTYMYYVCTLYIYGGWLRNGPHTFITFLWISQTKSWPLFYLFKIFYSLFTVNYAITRKVCTVRNKRFMHVPARVLDISNSSCTAYNFVSVLHVPADNRLDRRSRNPLLYVLTSVWPTSREVLDWSNV